jgi:HK97 family phage prohead protease
MTNTSDRKNFGAPFAIKELTEAGQFEGHCAVFGNIDLQGDKIRKSAFLHTIEETKGHWPVLFGHDTGRVVGFSTYAEEDSKGLYVRGEFTLDSNEGKDAHAVVRHAQKLKQPFGMSIGYRIRENGAEVDARTGIRVLHDLDILEFSVVPLPANPKARMTGVKSDDWTIRDLEQYLRDGGLSKEAAIAIAAGGFKALDRRDADEGKDDELRDAMALMSWVAKETFLLKER